MNDMMLEILAMIEQEETMDQATEIRLMEEFRQVINDVTPLMDQISESYEAALSVAPAELIGDLKALRESTLVLWPILVEAINTANTFDEYADKTESDPSFNEAGLTGGTASLRLDQYTIPECGFKLSN